MKPTSHFWGILQLKERAHISDTITTVLYARQKNTLEAGKRKIYDNELG